MIGRKTIGTIAHMSGGLELPSPFVKSWADMIQYNYEYLVQPTERILYIEAGVTYHSLARDTLVDEMRGDWMLMLDTDIAFEPDIAARMLNKMDKYDIDVLVGMYPYKGLIHAPVLYGYNPKKKKTFIIGDWNKKMDIIQIHSAGAGCLMVRKEVFEAIKKTGTSPFAIMEPYSEDNSFFERLAKLKIKAYFSPNISVRHLVYNELSIEKDFLPYKYKSVDKIDVESFR
jgi:Glycosyl transferase family 2